jgi:hypothetical protein
MAPCPHIRCPRVDMGIDVDNMHAHWEVDAIIDLDVGIDGAMDTGITTRNTHRHLQTRAKHMRESGD